MVFQAHEVSMERLRATLAVGQSPHKDMSPQNQNRLEKRCESLKSDMYTFCFIIICSEDFNGA